MNLAIWWIRRDIRLIDNLALSSALDFADAIIPLFILDPAILNSDRFSTKRVGFLNNSLYSLHTSLLSRNSKLVILSGNPLLVLQKIVHHLQQDHQIKIFAEADFSPYSLRRDQLIQQNLPLTLIGCPAYYPPDTFLKDDGSPYLTFTPYSKRWKSLPYKPPKSFNAPSTIPTFDFPSEIHPEELSSEKDLDFLPTEDEAQHKLDHFIHSSSSDTIYYYGINRDNLYCPQTSFLSPYLRFGLISIRQVVQQAMDTLSTTTNEEHRSSIQAWINELIWRDFYIQILYHFPHSIHSNLNNTTIKWVNNENDFIAWKEGWTGFPVVDAIMRQLRIKGWLPNRARMITASFLTKDLLIDWRWGESWFMQHLIDGDPAANVGGWQWCAGTGTDSVPYFRIMNPTTQSQKYDPEGKYIRKWVPELTLVPNEFIHEPHRMPKELQEKVKCIIGKDYPYPIVNHSEARAHTLLAYKQK